MALGKMLGSKSKQTPGRIEIYDVIADLIISGKD